MSPRVALVLVSLCGLFTTCTSFSGSWAGEGLLPRHQTTSPDVPRTLCRHAAARRGGVLAVCAKRKAAVDGGEQRLSKRVKRRNRAPPSLVESWKENMGSHGDGRIEILLDLDNAADAIEQVELLGLQDRCVMKGFAGVDYKGPTPRWLPIRRCTVRAKNGADFMLAFEAGRIAHEAASRGKDASGGGAEQGAERSDPPTAGAEDAESGEGKPMVVIVSSDIAMEVLVSELRHMGLPAHALYTASELEPLGKALRELSDGTGRA